MLESVQTGVILLVLAIGGSAGAFSSARDSVSLAANGNLTHVAENGRGNEHRYDALNRRTQTIFPASDNDFAFLEWIWRTI